jgi:hypothetical protein
MTVLRRALVVVACYVLALQAGLAAFATASMLAQTVATGGAAIICHGFDGAADADGVAPGDKAPCAHCALAAASGGLVPESPTVGATVRIATPAIAPAADAGAPALFPLRAGKARAPPRMS